MTNDRYSRRLVITVSDAGFLVEIEYQGSTGYWSCLSRTTVNKFPNIILNRAAGRNDFRIFVRAAKAAR